MFAEKFNFRDEGGRGGRGGGGFTKNQYIGGNCLKTVYRFKRGLAKRKGVVFLIGAEKGEG